MSIFCDSSNISHLHDRLVDLFVVCGYHSTVTANSHVFCGIKTKNCCLPNTTNSFSFAFGSMGLCCVFYYFYSFVLRQVFYSIHVTRMTIQMHWDYVFYITISLDGPF